MKKILLLSIVLFFLVIGQGRAIPHVSANLIFAAKLTGDQENPTVTTSAYGVASFILNGSRDTMCINVTMRDLGSAITGAHIHSGTFGVNGPSIVDLLPFTNGNRIFVTLSGASLSHAMVADFIARRLYINIETVNNPNGEIRGQIELETDYLFKAVLSGSEIVPADSSTAIGVATFSLHHDYMYTDLRLQVTGLSGPITSAQLHNAAPGSNGPEVMNLDSFINGNTIIAEIADQSFVYDLIAGNIYVNVSTAAYPGGEVRGQILLQSDLSFHLWMNGEQEVPPSSTTSSGSGAIYFSEWMDSIFIDAVFDSLTTAPNSAAFHYGFKGDTGASVLDVSTSLNGNHLIGMATGLPFDFIANCLLGNVYLNITTSQFLNGEIRGQIMRNAYEGFTCEIDGMQETPQTPAIATGSGFVSIDPQQRSAHYRMVVNNLSGPLTGAHFHEGTPGNPGNIIFDLTPYFSSTATNVSASNYWTDVDVGVPFDSGYAAMFLNNDAYVNFHTAMYPDGEVRGDIIQGGSCFLITSVADNIISESVSVYPLPSKDLATLSYIAPEQMNANIIISDISGRTISETPVHVLSGENKTNLDLSLLSTGVYFARLVSDGQIEFNCKLLKN